MAEASKSPPYGALPEPDDNTSDLVVDGVVVQRSICALTTDALDYVRGLHAGGMYVVSMTVIEPHSDRGQVVPDAHYDRTFDNAENTMVLILAVPFKKRAVKKPSSRPNF